MRAFYEAFSIGIAIFACLLFVITMGRTNPSRGIHGQSRALAVDRAGRL